MKKIEYRCKFCDRPGQTEYDPDCPGIHLEAWLKFLACNRCADFHTTKNVMMDKIASAAKVAETARVLGLKNAEEVRAQARAKLTQLTKNFTMHVCRYFGTQFNWDPEMVSLLMDQPAKAHHICMHLLRSHNHLKIRIA